ncbi:hypothetical protein [Segetibacter aerophilus]|uniref:Lipoprotein n=1 Tax=Segetibacter aerophilus TaxID=670293 RepID=A0A512B9L2_9BACT|nr:hypothetical protein [Segetibacter aerophilus]GEO08629.1 hypothetical protein SAE01_11250 [Segetibacter aerophilus]
MAVKRLIVVACYISTIIACSGPRQATSSTIGFVTLYNYLLNPQQTFKDDVSYAFIRNQNEFEKMFYMTKASPGTAVVPDFSSQSVVAIIFKPTQKVVSPYIQKAAIAGNELRIYYSIADTSAGRTYEQTPFVVATVPKSSSITVASFYKDGIKEKTITPGL